MTNIELAEKALSVFNDRANWTYCQGALGELGESKRVKDLYDYFRSKGGNTMTCDYDPWLEVYGRGKHCTDCSNFINLLMNYGSSRYSANDYGNMKECPDMLNAPAGSVLWMPGHVGIVVKKGWFVDFYAYNNTCRMGEISKSMFRKAVYIKDVVYTDTKPVKMDLAVVSKIRYIGDTLTYDDLVCTVTMDDGSKVTNPQGWQFTPTKLMNTANVIAGTYAGLVDYVNIPAKINGAFYGVQIPATSKEEAVKMQQELSAVYEGVAVVELS